VGEYPFSLAHLIFNSKDIFQSSKESLSDFLGARLTQNELTFLQDEQNQKIEKKDNKIVFSKSKSLQDHFIDVENKKIRNSAICLAYLKDGYSQIEIAEFLELPLIQR